jgi:hypothetical protein
MKATRFVMVIAVVCTSMFAAKTTPAKDGMLNSVQMKLSGGVVLVNRQQLLQLAKSLGLKVYTFKGSKPDARKLSSSNPNGCGCSLVQDSDGFGGCFTRCLQSWGISYASAVACGGACVGASAGNPIAIAVCAACLGTGEWIVLGCSLNCAWTRNFGELMEARAIHPQNRKNRSVKTPPRLVARM